jgi:hypothetical protein
MDINRYAMRAAAVALSLFAAAALPAQSGAQGAHNLAAPASEAAAVPGEGRVEIMVKQALLTLNDANLTNNYSVFHARLAPVFRREYSVEKFADIFKAFRDRAIDLSPIALFRPTYIEAPSLGDDGVLRMRGYFPTVPSRLYFDLAYADVGGKWMLFAINVDVKSPSQAAVR